MAVHAGKIELIWNLRGAHKRYRFNIYAGNGTLLASGVRWYEDRAKARRVARNIIWLFRRRKIKIVFDK